MPHERLVPFVVVAGAAIAIGTAMWWTLQRSHPDTDHPNVASASAERPDQPVAAAPRMRPLPVVSLEPDIAASERESELRATQTASAEAIARTAQTQLRALFESERVDSEWARRKEQALERASATGQIPELGAEPRSFAASCRSSTCQVVATFDTRPQADDWFTLFSLNAGAEMPNAAVERTMRGDGTVQVDIYGLARQP